jgi:hypothetical protein
VEKIQNNLADGWMTAGGYSKRRGKRTDSSLPSFCDAFEEL